MSGEISVPQLGESIVEATVGRWLKQEGDSVTEGEPVVELETEKVNMEVAAPSAGVLTTISKQEGATVAIGDVLGTIGAAQGATTANVVSEAQTARLAAETNAVAAPSVAMEGDGGKVSPLARRIASEHGIDLSLINGSGPGGRVMQEDVNDYLASRSNGKGDGNGARTQTAAQTPAVALTASANTTPAVTHGTATTTRPATPSSAQDSTKGSATAAGRAEERVRLSRRRQTIARRLVEAQHNAAMLTTFNEVDMSAIMEVRKRRRDAFKAQHGIGLGFMSFFTKAVIGALKAFPRLNAEIQGDEMVLKRYYDIGIAVGVDEGLVVPVLRDADRMTFAEIEQQIATLADKARKNTLSLEELQGGTFTITNGGTFGSLLSTPILNAPQVGILGMHKIEERPIALNGQVVIHPMMYLALSYDHRIVDGSEAVRFLVRVKELLEDPETLLLEG